MSSYLGDQDAVTNGNTHGQSVALLVEGTGADSHNLGLVELLNAGLGQEDAAGGLGLGLDTLDQDTVKEGSESSDGSNRGGLECIIRSARVFFLFSASSSACLVVH